MLAIRSRPASGLLRAAPDLDSPDAAWTNPVCDQFPSIREWRGHDVADAQGHKIGELEAVYVDTSTDLPSFWTVQVGMPGRRRLVFVPLDRAIVGPGYLKYYPAIAGTVR